MNVRSHKKLFFILLMGALLTPGCAPQEQPPANPPKLPPAPPPSDGGEAAARYRNGGQGTYKPPATGTTKP